MLVSFHTSYDVPSPLGGEGQGEGRLTSNGAPH